MEISFTIQKGGWWVDTDLVCVKSIKDEPYYMDDFVFVSEPDPKGNGDYNLSEATTCMIKMKRNSMPVGLLLIFKKNINLKFFLEK